jgi:hypothetical protein
MTALTVLDGGWKDDEAQIEALVFMDEVAIEAEKIYGLLGQLQFDLGSHPQFGQGQFLAKRLMRRATTARIEYAALTGGNGGTAA